MSAILAYFDPGSGSLLVQVLVGGIAGLIVFGKYLWNSVTGSLRNRKWKTPGSDNAAILSESSGEISQDAFT
jgi:hypothetical protein